MTDAERIEYARAQAVGVWPLVRGAFWCVAGLLIITVILYSVFWLPYRAEPEPPYPLPILPPAPTAEAPPPQGYKWVNREASVVRIPIDEAMRVTAERLPVRANVGKATDRKPAGAPMVDSGSGRRPQPKAKP